MYAATDDDRATELVHRLRKCDAPACHRCSSHRSVDRWASVEGVPVGEGFRIEPGATAANEHVAGKVEVLLCGTGRKRGRPATARAAPGSIAVGGGHGLTGTRLIVGWVVVNVALISASEGSGPSDWSNPAGKAA